MFLVGGWGVMHAPYDLKQGSETHVHSLVNG